ncbi:hypothetical protein J6590_016917 [Homalodisca vitripennis]|nr:hypothetical protein J6590_016917 [Homalodisca vitripennis]
MIWNTKVWQGFQVIDTGEVPTSVDELKRRVVGGGRLHDEPMMDVVAAIEQICRTGWSLESRAIVAGLLELWLEL